jgi:ABC-type spermidine/putrescine transport system permease subunit II
VSIIKKAALYFARKEYCKTAIKEHADLSIFKEKLTVSLIAGLVLITISYLIGIPAVFIIGGIAAWLKNPTFGVIGIPLIYGFSWLLLMLGLYLAGPKYGKAISRWTVRIILEKILGDEAKTIRPLPQEDSEKHIIKN